MDASEQYLFADMPTPVEVGFTGWQDRLHKLREMSDSYGGLLPRASLHEALGVTKQRVATLCEQGILEVINFCGTQFISGRSLVVYNSDQKAKGGRGHKLTRWQGLRIGASIGKAFADVACPE